MLPAEIVTTKRNEAIAGSRRHQAARYTTRNPAKASRKEAAAD
ncbi:hypothetical protein RI444_19840 [Paenarthrobacter sp. AT5]|nr:MULTISPECIES: hypothetical protein [Paenarthrobacter]AOY73780.1 hypothetical protein ARZXY2_4280 [Arthrobacter sp. ZXY-2]WOC60720.1 hypothetical protein RI444_19840 [Paenarthrobacter sp. AT5]